MRTIAPKSILSRESGPFLLEYRIERATRDVFTKRAVGLVSTDLQVVA